MAARAARRERRLVAAFAGLSRFSARRPRHVLILVALATLLLGLGLPRLETTANFVNILPRGDPNTVAAHNISREFTEFFDQVTLYPTLDESKWREANARLPNRATVATPGNITDEVYVRGMQELFLFLRTQIPELRHHIDLASIVMTLNWSNSGVPGVRPPDDAAFAMPGTDRAGELQYAADWEGARRNPQLYEAISPDGRTALMTLIFERGATSHQALGAKVFRALAAYEQWAPRNARFDVFDHGQLAAEGYPIVDARATENTRNDLLLLGPMVFVFIFATLWIAFRHWPAVAITGAFLLVIFAWSAGLMGWLGIPFSSLNLTIVPLILGVGIDYAVHVTNDFHLHRARGLAPDEAFRLMGPRSAAGLFIATLTTLTGLVPLVLSPSVALVQFGIVSSISMTFAYLLAVTFVPAALSVAASPAGRRYRPSRLVPAAAGLVTRRRFAGTVLVFLVTVALLASAQTVRREAFGNPELNFPEGDVVREYRETIDENFYGGEARFVPDFIVLEGDILEPATHAYIRALKQNLVQDERLRIETVATLVDVVEGYLTIRDGTPGAVAFTARQALQPGAGYPATREEMKATLDALFASPMATFASFFVNPDYSISVVNLDVFQQPTFESARFVWNELWRIVDETGRQVGTPLAVRFAIFGNTAFSFLFIDRELPWITYMGLASFGASVALVAWFMRSWKATLTVGGIMFATGIWWLGVLPLFGIGISPGLILPMVFIMAIGSDYATHLVWHHVATGQPREAYGSVGKAVVFSALTDFGAFAIFTNLSDLMAREAMLATALSIGVIFMATLLITPLFYGLAPVARAARGPGGVGVARA